MVLLNLIVAVLQEIYVGANANAQRDWSMNVILSYKYYPTSVVDPAAVTAVLRDTLRKLRWCGICYPERALKRPLVHSLSNEWWTTRLFVQKKNHSKLRIKHRNPLLSSPPPFSPPFSSSVILLLGVAKPFRHGNGDFWDNNDFRYSWRLLTYPSTSLRTEKYFGLRTRHAFSPYSPYSFGGFLTLKLLSVQCRHIQWPLLHRSGSSAEGGGAIRLHYCIPSHHTPTEYCRNTFLTHLPFSSTCALCFPFSSTAGHLVDTLLQRTQCQTLLSRTGEEDKTVRAGGYVHRFFFLIYKLQGVRYRHRFFLIVAKCQKPRNFRFFTSA